MFLLFVLEVIVIVVIVIINLYVLLLFYNIILIISLIGWDYFLIERVWIVFMLLVLLVGEEVGMVFILFLLICLLL